MNLLYLDIVLSISIGLVVFGFSRRISRIEDRTEITATLNNISSIIELLRIHDERISKIAAVVNASEERHLESLGVKFPKPDCNGSAGSNPLQNTIEEHYK